MLAEVCKEFKGLMLELLRREIDGARVSACDERLVPIVFDVEK